MMHFSMTFFCSPENHGFKKIVLAELKNLLKQNLWVLKMLWFFILFRLITKVISMSLERKKSILQGSFNEYSEFSWKKRKIIFFHKFKLCIDWNRLIAKIILILQKYLLWDYSKWWKIRVLQVWWEVCCGILAGWEVHVQMDV